MTDLLLTQADLSGRLSFTVTQSPRAVRGLSQLIQQIVVDLLSSYRPDLGRGSGLRDALSQITTDNESEATSVVNGAVRAVSGFVIARQNMASNLSADERLKSITVLSVSYSPSSGWDIKLELTPESGPPVTLSLPGA